MKQQKKHIVLALVLSLLLGLISTPPVSQAAKKPRLSKKLVTITEGDSSIVKIVGIKNKQIEHVDILSTDDEVTDANDESNTSFTVYGYEKGSATIKFSIFLKKKIKGKKKYTLKLKVKVTGLNTASPTSGPVFTQSPVHTTAPTPDANSSVKYISDRSVEYNTEYSEHRVFFSLKDASETRVAGSGNAIIKITNEDGTVVYNQTKRFAQSDFSSWTSAAYGTRLLCCIHITDTEIEKGTAKKGSLTLEVTLDNGCHFDEAKYSIGDLPLVEATSVVKIELPQVPITLHDYDYKNSIRYSYNLTNIRYTAEKNYSGSYTVYIYYSGNKTYDYRGPGQSSRCTIAGKLYKAGTNTVADSDSAYSPSVNMNDSFEDVKATIYNISPGDYRLEVLSTN